jgi:hypothetical protein
MHTTPARAGQHLHQAKDETELIEVLQGGMVGQG